MKNIKTKLDEIARENGYLNTECMLMDYGIIPTVRIPNHKKIELIKLLLSSKKHKK